MEHKEYNLQKAVCKYLEAQYPSVLFLSDTVASVKLTAMQGVRNKAIQKKGFKTPDLIILKPNNSFHGLFIELKTESPYKKDGTIKVSQNDHLKLQEETLIELNKLGYLACFAWEFETIKQILDMYLSIQSVEHKPFKAIASVPKNIRPC